MSESGELPLVLLVEDDALVALVAEETLRVIGFEPISVRTGAEGLAALNGAAPLALAVIDVGLPDLRGDDLAERARGLLPGLPIVVASGYDDAGLIRRFLDDPATTILAKPYTERDLRRALARLGL
jgi:CheY-like chemotaxis protein